MNGFATTFVPVGRFLCAMALLIALTGAALVAQPVEAQVERLERRVHFERAPKIFAAIRVHVVV